ncbi:MAG: PKD domain-containing protein [Desulfobulbaceae bacterium]|nr:PKD domain-containing protein [Desulfobulbaceae bacterium]
MRSLKSTIFLASCVVVVVMVNMLLFPPGGQALVIKEVPLHPGGVVHKKAKPFLKAGSALNKVYTEYRAHAAARSNVVFKPSNSFLMFSRGKVVVDAVEKSSGTQLLNELKGVGLQKGVRFNKVVSGWLPIGAINRASKLNSLRFISASYRPITNTGAVTSQGDVAMYADIARSTTGLTGAGITVGVLSDSYDQQDGADADVLGGDLPDGPMVNVLDDSANCGSFLPAPCSDEGRAMLQIVYDVAPSASLSFNTAFTGMAGFADGILSLASAGADVIVDDVQYYAEPMFQDGIIAQAVDQVVGDGVAYFSSAGNQAAQSYEYSYTSSGEPFIIEDWFYGLRFVGILHDFDPGNGTDYLQNITVASGECAIISLQWDQPFGSLAGGNGSLVDLDIYLVQGDESGLSILARSDTDNVAGGEPVELLQFCNDQPTDNFNLMISYFFEPDPGGGYDSWTPSYPTYMKYVHFGSITVNEYATNSSTVYGHANAAGAEAVGAAYYPQTPAFDPGSPPQLEYFSSHGGTPILMDGAGQRLANPMIRNKPGIVAPDGVDTTFFYPTSDRNDNGIPDFSGTSAAAPHAAAVAALMLEAKSEATVPELYASLETTAVDMEGVGFDYKSGYGLIKADDAIGHLMQANSSPVAEFIHETDNLTVTFIDKSSDSDGVLVGWNWNFGDDIFSNLQNPIHTYLVPGDFNVTLFVTDDLGANDITSQVVTLSAPNQVNAPLNLTADVNGDVVTLFWFDTADNEQGIYVERATKIRGKYSFVRLPEAVSANETQYNDVVEPGTYKYRVQAFSGTVFSDYSNELLVKVEAVVISACGDGVCDSTESVCDCVDDCGTPLINESGYCADGLDNDCDNLYDCDDPNCTDDSSCACKDKKEYCVNGDECCSKICLREKCK